ncbi:Dabb family protein [Streptomyces gobiensis]|uniref:Dabb family protein n=1 Tax=Streptomyces gobiensis TaxID=2875706 RepID=UPI001E585867|nr:Dabb family protein [Streptomyces gobiensis]UGY91938.1 Dabb family protein [Streptomyces gobiensis]
MLTHVVLMRFTDPADAPEAKKRLAELPALVSEIESMRVGLDVTGSAVSYDLCMTTRHASAAALAGYQSHPAHRALGDWLRPRLADRVTVDYVETAGD